MKHVIKLLPCIDVHDQFHYVDLSIRETLDAHFIINKVWNNHTPGIEEDNALR